MLKPLASLQLTVVLFALAAILVFLGTIAQKNEGIWKVVDKYFWSTVVMVDTKPLVQFGQIFLNVPQAATESSFAQQSFPFFGGKLLGILMFINLISAHILRFKLSWKRSGIFILHGGIMLLFIGEYITREFQVEQQMTITKGSYSDFTIDTKNFELAFVQEGDENNNHVVVVPATQLEDAVEKSKTIAHPDLPVDLKVVAYYHNSRPVTLDKLPDNPATAGEGITRGILPANQVPGVDLSKETDIPSTYVTLLKKGTEEVIATYLFTLWVDDQTIVIDGKPNVVSLRRTHIQKPFKLHLIDFKFARFRGTETAKEYTSVVRLDDKEANQDREVVISMNDPFRYRGETFYQADFDKATEKTTILQVVRNPGWILPYASCFMVSLGMLVHFGIGLISFVNSTRAKRSVSPVAVAGSYSVLGAFLALFSKPVVPTTPDAVPKTKLERYLPFILVGIIGLYILSLMMPRKVGDFDLKAAARIPVIEGGRVKPLDTVARVDLRRISTREEFNDANDKTQRALRWYLATAAAPSYATAPAATNRVFRIDNDQVLGLLQLTKQESDNWRFSHEQIWAKGKILAPAALKAAQKNDKERDLFEQKLLELWKRLGQFEDVSVGRGILLFPPKEEGGKWQGPFTLNQQADQHLLNVVAQMGKQYKSVSELEKDIAAEENAERRDALFMQLEKIRAESLIHNEYYMAWRQVLSAYRAQDQARFDSAVAKFQELQTPALNPGDQQRVRFEAWLNDTSLYYHCTGLYVIAFVLSMIGFVGLAFGNASLGNAMRKGTLGILLLTLLVHTFTLFSRMYLMDRPLVFVTNLYSSAVFIGWAAVCLCLIIERIYPIGLGNVVGSAIGFATTIIAHNLASSGDTLEMMQAVLDTNFWLATHVTTVTLGYSATYIAGIIGFIYIIVGVFTPYLKSKITMNASNGTKTLELGRVLGQVMYGIICLAALLSFVGTVLGGIWADQSWGRFWGWDPKENGAVLIVLWNALILHARWCGLVKDRGIAVLALAGNMITTWSWFGTNQLSVGLHAYGFSDTLSLGCTITWGIHLGLIAMGLIPTRFWMTNSSRPTA